MIKISLPARVAIQKALANGCKTVADAISFIESDPGYENWVADDVMNTVQAVYGPNCPLERVEGVSAFSYQEIEGKGEGDGEGTCQHCGKPKPMKGTGQEGAKTEPDKGEGQQGQGDGKGDGEGQEGQGDGNGGHGEGECQGHGENGEGDGDGKGKSPGKPGGNGRWMSRFGKQWFTKDVLDSPFITGDFDGIAKEAREWSPSKSVGDRVNSCLSQIADLGGDTDDEPDRYHIGRLVTRIACRQGGLDAHCRRNERGRRKVLLLPDVSGSCVAFSASALDFCYSAAMVDERIVVVETFNGQIRKPGEEHDGDPLEEDDIRRRHSAFPFTKTYYEEKLRVGDSRTMRDREKTYIDWIMNGDFCAVIALGDTQGGWLYSQLDQKGMKVFWMDPGDYQFAREAARKNGVEYRGKTVSLGRYAPLPARGLNPRSATDAVWHEGHVGRDDSLSALKRYRNLSYSVNMSHDVEGFIEALELIIKES